MHHPVPVRRQLPSRVYLKRVPWHRTRVASAAAQDCNDVDVNPTNRGKKRKNLLCIFIFLLLTFVLTGRVLS